MAAGNAMRGRRSPKSRGLVDALARFRFRNPDYAYHSMLSASRRYMLQAIPKWKQAHKRYLYRAKRFGKGNARTRQARREMVKARTERRTTYHPLALAKGSVRRGLLLDPRYAIFNHRAFLERLFGTFRGERIPTNYSMAVIDIDYLRKINKAGGHPAGDEAIGEICKLAVRDVAARLGGVAGRLGGDELEVFAPVGKTELKRVLDRVQQRYNDYYTGYGLRFSFSAGVAGKADLDTMHKRGFSGPQARIDALYELADIAESLAKKRGKARTVEYRPRR